MHKYINKCIYVLYIYILYKVIKYLKTVKAENKVAVEKILYNQKIYTSTQKKKLPNIVVKLEI